METMPLIGLSLSFTSRATVLVVDDEEDIRDLLCESLEDAGFTCLAAGSASEALKVVESHGVDLALVDLVMPGMSGLDLFLHLSRSHPEVGVVFVTAMEIPEFTERVLKAGAYDCIIKPVTYDSLVSRVERALERRRAFLAECHPDAGESLRRIQELQDYFRRFLKDFYR